MKPETEAKALIALIISLIAFGCGSGAGIVMGINQNDTLNTQISNTSQDMPQIPNTKNVNTHTQNQQTSSPVTTNEELYVEDNNNQNGQPPQTGNTNSTGNGTP